MQPDLSQFGDIVLRQVGWQNELRSQDVFSADGFTRLCIVAGQTEGTENDLFVQLNEIYSPSGYMAFAVCMYAMRYDICSGWYPCIFDCRLNRQVEIGLPFSISERIDFERISSLHGRELLCMSFPECCGYTWERIRAQGTPYTVLSDSDSLQCIANRLQGELRTREPVFRMPWSSLAVR